NPFVAACDKFIYTEILRADAEEPAPAKTDAGSGKAADKPTQAQAAKAQSDKEKPPLNFIARVIEDISDDEDWVHLGALGQNLNKRSPAFDTRLYGFKKLSELLKAHPNRFEVQEAGSGSKALRVRNKRKR
ncbi:MAG TPA: hypothetical protein DIU19_00560, partial [Alcanivorax sp.]|nr:hypothetical protein [Alcanivorax sp.]